MPKLFVKISGILFLGPLLCLTPVHAQITESDVSFGPSLADDCSADLLPGKKAEILDAVAAVKESFAEATERLASIGGKEDASRCNQLKEIATLAGSWDRLRAAVDERELDLALCATPAQRENLTLISEALKNQVDEAIREDFGAKALIQDAKIALATCETEEANKAIRELIQRPGVCNETVLREALKLRYQANSSKGLPEEVQSEVSRLLTSAEKNSERCNFSRALDEIQSIKELVGQTPTCGGGEADLGEIEALEQKILSKQYNLEQERQNLEAELAPLVESIEDLKRDEPLAMESPGKYERSMKRRIFSTRLALVRLQKRIQESGSCYSSLDEKITRLIDVIDRVKVPGR